MHLSSIKKKSSAIFCTESKKQIMPFIFSFFTRCFLCLLRMRSLTFTTNWILNTEKGDHCSLSLRQLIAIEFVNSYTYTHLNFVRFCWVEYLFFYVLLYERQCLIIIISRSWWWTNFNTRSVWMVFMIFNVKTKKTVEYVFSL